MMTEVTDSIINIDPELAVRIMMTEVTIERDEVTYDRPSGLFFS